MAMAFYHHSLCYYARLRSTILVFVGSKCEDMSYTDIPVPVLNRLGFLFVVQAKAETQREELAYASAFRCNGTSKGYHRKFDPYELQYVVGASEGIDKARTGLFPGKDSFVSASKYHNPYDIHINTYSALKMKPTSLMTVAVVSVLLQRRCICKA
ncbi:hypothetical protein BUE80_DR006457 [Diplocarpon rosae]|nr:hypothetical protein BUE80_DR006457 [Diplocarpon rosae]